MEAKMESLSHPSQACATYSPHQPNFNTLSWGPTLMSGRPPPQCAVRDNMAPR